MRLWDRCRDDTHNSLVRATNAVGVRDAGGERTER
jgi:hypothetical protein